MGGTFTSPTTGTLPYKADLFKEATNGLRGKGNSFLHISAAHGRSLERSITTDDEPRHLVAIPWYGDHEEVDTAIGWRRTLFFGYTKANEQLQIIAPSDGFGNGGANDFIVVNDFRDGGQPTFSYAPNGLCTSCHQGGVPIFPVSPWTELRDPPADSILIADRDIGQRERPASHFNEDVRMEAIAGGQLTACLRACGTSVACRWELLKTAVNGPTGQSPPWMDAAWKTVPSAEKIAIGRALRSSILEDRTPLASSPFAIDVGAASDPLADRDYGFTEGDVVIRSAPGPTSVGAAAETGAEQCADVGPREGELRSGLRSALAQLSPARYVPGPTAELLARRWPLSKADLATVLEQLQAKNPTYLTSSEANERRSVPLVATLAPPPTPPLGAGEGAEDVFTKRCATCHGTGLAPVLTFAGARSYVGPANASRTAVNLVKKNLMPPFDAPQLSRSEKTKLLQAFGR